MNINKIKVKLLNKQDLTTEETSEVFNLIMSGDVSEVDIATILIALKMKNENKNEIHGAAKIMRQKSMKMLLLYLWVINMIRKQQKKWLINLYPNIQEITRT